MLIYQPGRYLKHTYSIKSHNLKNKLLILKKDVLLYGGRSADISHSTRCKGGKNGQTFKPFIDNSRFSTIVTNFSHGLARGVEFVYVITTITNLTFQSNHRRFYTTMFGRPFKKNGYFKPLTHTKEFLKNHSKGYRRDAIVLRQPMIIKLGFLGTNANKLWPNLRRIHYNKKL